MQQLLQLSTQFNCYVISEFSMQENPWAYYDV